MNSQVSPQVLMDEIQQLKEKNQQLEDSLKSKEIIHQQVLQYGRLFSSMALELVEISDGDIHDFCARNLKKILPHSTIMVSSYDKKTDNFVLASINGITKKEMCIMEKLMGNNLLEAKADFNKLDDRVQKSLFTQELMENPGGLYLATGQVFPEKLCKCAETLFGVTGVYGIGLSWNNKLYGSVAIFSMGDDVLIKKDLIETIVSMLSVAMQRQQAENKIKETLKEKELLMREIHYRTKNNLMIMSSLLDLQSEYVDDSETLALFHESQDRAKAMALIHERLYSSENLKSIDFGEYLSTLVLNLSRSYVAPGKHVELKMNIENIMLDADNAIPLGLISNELITNALKHAFPKGDDEAELTLEFYSYKNTFYLVVKDNGVGVGDDFDFKNCQSLGLQIVNILTRQIGGEITIKSDQGTTFTITFKEVDY